METLAATVRHAATEEDSLSPASDRRPERSLPSSPGLLLNPVELVEPDEPEDMIPDQKQPEHDVVDAEDPHVLLVDIENDGGNLLNAYRN